MADKSKKIALTITANTRQLRRDFRRAGREVKTFERQVMGLGAKMRQVRMRLQSTGIFGRGGGALRTAAGFAGVFGFQQMISSAKEESAALTDIQITGNLTDRQLQKLRKSMYEVSNATGKSTSEVLSFVSAMTTATGDTAAAMVALEEIGKVAVATGTDMGALGQVFVKLTTSMKVLPREAGKAFNILRAQEKKGAVTMSEMATALPEVVGAAGIMGKSATGLRGVSALGGLMQLTRRGTGGVEQAKTSTARFLQAIYKERKKIKKHLGVNIMDEDGNVRDLTTIFGELAVSMARPGKLGLAASKIFNERSIKAATQLALAGRVGLGGKQGTLESFKSVFGAGKKDVISADFKTRMKSPAQQFDVQMNILKNAFKRHMVPVFEKLAAGLKKWGPDLVRTMKFLLEHSAGLLKLWLGYKGVTFFQRLMAPVQGGAQDAAAMAGMGGMAMLPGGQMVRAGGLGMRPGGMYLRGQNSWQGWGGVRRDPVGWKSAGRSGGMYYSGREFNEGWNAVPGMAGGRRQGRFGRAGQWAGGIAGRYGGRAFRYGGQAAGAAGMMGMIPSYGNGYADMGANMAMMSPSPHLQAVGAGYKYTGWSASLKSRSIGQRFGVDVGEKWGGRMDWANKYGGPMRALNSLVFDAIKGGEEVDLGKILNKKINAKLNKEYKENLGKAQAGIDKFYGDTDQGMTEQENINKLTGQFGGYMGPGGVMGIAPTQGAALARKLGTKGLRALRSKFVSAKANARAAATIQLRKGGYKGEITEEKLMETSSQYAKLKDLEEAIGELIVQLRKGMSVSLKQPSGSTPGERLQANADAGMTIPSS